MSPIAQALLLQKLKPETPIALAEGGTLVRPSTGEIVARGAPKTVNPTDFQRNYQAEVEQDKTLGIPPPTMAEYHASTNPAVQKTVETAMNDVQSDQDLIAKFDRALELSKVAYAGHAARARAEAVGWTGSKAAEATQELESLTNAQTIGQLSQIHGGRMSTGKKVPPNVNIGMMTRKIATLNWEIAFTIDVVTNPNPAKRSPPTAAIGITRSPLGHARSNRRSPTGSRP
jgi:hypothetical protein